MPMAPAAIGYEGQTVRPIIQAVMDKIDALMLDPVYVSNNNKASKEDKALGVKIYQFHFDGQLNEVEKSTIEDGWIAAGWTSALCDNDYPSPTESKGNPRWSLAIKYQP